MAQTDFTVLGVHHVQLAMPAGKEVLARRFYAALLGLLEVDKPPELAARGGCWFETDQVRLHLGVEADFRPARKAHPALLVSDLKAAKAALTAAGHPPLEEGSIPGFDRMFVADPFGNRIKLLQSH